MKKKWDLHSSNKHSAEDNWKQMQYSLTEIFHIRSKIWVGKVFSTLQDLLSLIAFVINKG